ncbi:MAG: DNA cytosine methyltransferase [Eubacterium sp.]|nr:DNA cytosine methyltransferase [Eubacterium sp.]
MFIENNGKYNFIDLFAGAGGLSEGFFQEGFNPIAHVEMNEYASNTLETRSCYYYFKKESKLDVYYKYLKKEISREDMLNQVPSDVIKTVINETMTDKSISGIFNRIDEIMKEDGIKEVDVIIGGPPCQAYSLVGRAQSKHMRTPMSEDPRNDLYKLYARFLRKYQPKMFVFENVMGIITANNGKTWKNIKSYLRRVGYEIEWREQNSKDFGVLQNRRRMIIVGWLKNSGLSYPEFEKIQSEALVNDLLYDLPALTPGTSSNKYTRRNVRPYVLETGIRTNDDVLTMHECRPNIDRDIQIYQLAVELWNNGHQRLKYYDLPDELVTHKNTRSFVDRFKVVEGDEHCCHTILAHLSKDGHYFIHPDINQHRSITPREAARIQSFPDSYYFEGPRTAQFVQIGNAVPPMMARGIARGIKAQLPKEE